MLVKFSVAGDCLPIVIKDHEKLNQRESNENNVKVEDEDYPDDDDEAQKEISSNFFIDNDEDDEVVSTTAKTKRN